MDGIEKLLALEELRLLKARYFERVDAKRWDEWGELFEPDVLAEFPDEPPGFTFRGRDEFVAAIAASLGAALTIHHGHTPQLEILSPTRAKGIWTMQDILRWPDDAELPPAGARNIDGWGHYHETYVKSDAGWRIATLKLTRVRLVKY